MFGSPRLAAQETSSQSADPAGSNGDESFDNQVAQLRNNIRWTTKKLVAANLTLTDSEAAKFWPVYEQYSALHMADSITTLNPKMSWRLKLLLLHSMLSQVIYRKSLHRENIHKNRFHRSSRDTLVLRIATLNLEDAQHQPCPSMPREMEKPFKLLSSKALKPISI